MKSIKQSAKIFLTSAALIWMAAFLVFSFVSQIRNADASETPENLRQAIEQVAKQSIPAVVHIQVTEYQEVQNPLSGLGDDPYLRQFFGLPRNMPKKFRREMMGIGSGVIIDPKGYIVTNNHVVGGASKIIITLSDGRAFAEDKVSVVGTDPKTDLAVVKISASENLPSLELADSDKVQVGQWVVAIGQPEGLTESVTQGIISAKHRSGITHPTAYQDFLQTDAAINPGNSGGPLLDLDAKIVGINAAIASKSGGFEGIGFAIPSNMAQYVSQQLIAHGRVVRGWLGITMMDVTPALAKEKKLSTNEGAYVVETIPGSPADSAGLKKGDVIVGYEGKPITNSGMLRNEVARASVGQNINMTILQNDRKEQVSVKIASEKEQQKVMHAALKKEVGISIRPLNEEEAQKYGLKELHGVMITAIEPGSPFAKAGFEKDDAIISIEGQPVDNVSELDLLLNALPSGQKVRVMAGDHRSGQVGYVPLTVP